MAAQYIPIKRISSLDTPIKAEKLDGSLFTTENQAHEFIISVRKNGVKQTVTGSVSGKFIRANGTTIFLQGSIVDGDAVVRLHQDCYNVQGRFTFNIFNTQSGVTTCIYSAVGKIDMGSTETVIDAGDVVPDVSDVVAAQEAAQAATNAANTAAATANTAANNVGSIVARPYSNSFTYAVGDYVTYNGNLYKCSTAITTAEEWTSGHWAAAVLGDDLFATKSALNDISEWGGVNYIDNRIASWYQGNFDGSPSTRAITSNHFQLPLGATLTFSRRTVDIGNIALLRGFTSEGTLVWQKEISGFTSTTFVLTSNSSIAYWQLQIYNSDNSAIALADFFAQAPELQLQEGSTATSYTPYESARVSSALINRISTLEDTTSDLRSAIEQISNDNLPMIFVKGEYVALNGNFLTSPAWSRTEFIRVDKYSEIIITSTKQSAYNCFYDEDHNHIASFNCAVGAMHRLIPANAVYIALSNETQNMLETTVVPYTVKKETEINDAIEELSEIKANKFTKDSQNYLYELFLTGFDDSKNIVIGQIANKYVAGSGYYSGIYFAYEDAPTAWIAAWSTAYDIQTPCVVKLNEMNSSGVTGYACLDFKKITEGTRIYPRIVVNKEYIKDVGKSPSITSYINGYNSTDINWLNKDMDMAVVQASQTKARLFPDYDASLEFVHFTDIHGAADAWKRIIDYINSHDSYIQFALHTGDYVISAQDSSVDLYGTVTPNRRPILNVVGNHDVQVTDGSEQAAQADTYNLLFSDSANWGATFPQVANAMYYYKDFANKNLRFVVIDQYYWDEAEATWLGNVLEDARTNGYHVVTASHTQSGPFERMLKTTFNTIDDYEPYTQWGENVEPFELLIKSFKDAGGKHVANLCGHWHHDMSGVTKNGILNLVAECATPFGVPWVNTPRLAGTRSYDCFNVVSVDTVTNIIRLIRIGDQYDGYLQHKTVVCIDYVTQEIKEFDPDAMIS